MIKTKCFKNALQDMRQRDTDALEAGVKARITAGASNLSTIKQAEISAARDLLAEIAQERAEVLRLAKEQHPETNRASVKNEEMLAPEEAKRVVDAFLETVSQDLKDRIEFYPSAKDVPVRLLKLFHEQGGLNEDGEMPRGALLKGGRILVIGDAHKNVADLLETLAHEIVGHYGVRKLLGKEGIAALAQRLADQKLIASTAEALGVQEGLAEARKTSRQAGESPQKTNERAVEEILAHLEEKRPSEKVLQKLGRFVYELMGAINAALVKMGLRSPYKVTPADLYHILRQARNALKEEGNAVEGDIAYRKAKSTSPELSAAAEVFIGGKNRSPIADIREHATGLAIRTRFVDNYAALKEALKRGDAMAAIQVSYDLMNYAQRNHFVQQAVTVGAPTRSWWGKEKGKDVYKTEAQEGASMKRVSELLNNVEGFGNAQDTSNAFTMYALAKRAADPEFGWARVFADMPTPHNTTVAQKAEIDKINAKKAAARAEADKLIADPNSPFKAAYREYQDWNKGMLQFAMQAGVVSEEEFRRLASKQNYTPLFRADKHGNLVLEIDRGRDITVGRLADEPHMHKLLGGDGQVMDFFTASVRNASVLIDASLHNIASREAFCALEAMGAAHPISESEKGEGVIEFRKDGVLQRTRIDTTGTKAADIPADLLVKGFAGVPASLPGFVRMMGVPAQVLRKAVTRNPLYMARQLVRDPLSAWLTTGAQFNPLTDTLKEMSKSLSGTADKTLDRRGITGGALFSDDIDDLKRIQDEAQSEGSGWNIGYYMAKMDHAAHAADAITRRNVYNGAIKEGASEIQATLAAYESMPFSKRGTSPSMRYLNHMVPFLSAAIQGWDVLYRSVKGDMPLNELVDVRNKLLARGTMIAGMSMLYAMAMADDDEYQKANTSERLNNWFLTMPGTDQKIKVPVPFELGIIFKMLPEALVRIMHSDKDAGTELRDVGGALAAMVPNLAVPQAIMPLVEAKLNRSFFTGRAIEGRALEGMDIGKRFDANTSEMSKALGFDFDVMGAQVGLSPKMFEYVMSQYTAGLYPAMAALIDTMLPAPTPSKPDRKMAELPLFRSVLLQEDAGGEVNRLYDKIEKFTKASSTLKRLQETNPEQAMKYFEDNKEEVGKGMMAAKMKAAIDKISNAENKIRASGMSPEQKREALDNFKRVKSNLATQFSANL